MTQNCVLNDEQCAATVCPAESNFVPHFFGLKLRADPDQIFWKTNQHSSDTNPASALAAGTASGPMFAAEALAAHSLPTHLPGLEATALPREPTVCRWLPFTCQAQELSATDRAQQRTGVGT